MNGDLNFYNASQQSKPDNRLYHLIFTHPDFRRMYLRRLRTLMDTLLKSPGTPAAELPIETRIREWLDLVDPPEIPSSDADLDYAKWGTWGNRNQVRADAQRIIDTHLPGRRQFLLNNAAATVNGERVPAAQPAHARVTIGDIEFNPPSRNQEQEFVQLVNPESYAVDVSGWKLSGGVEFTFRSGTVIPANGALYVSPNVPAFRARTSGPRGKQGLFVQGNYDGRLSAWGETVTLLADNGRVVNTKNYTGNPSAAQRFLRVTEIMFNPAPQAGIVDAQNLEFIELKNVGSASLDLSGVRFAGGIEYQFSTNSPRTLMPGQFVLVAKDLAAFTARYGADLPVAGPFTGNLDNSGETLRLDDADGEKILEFAYDREWQPQTDGRGHSLVVVDQNALWPSWEQASQWRASMNPGGSPGLDDLPLITADSDRDGMPDTWEISYGLNPAFDDAQEDLDGDGLSNYHEFVAGTDPRAAASALKLDATVESVGAVVVSFQAVANRNYRVLYKTDLRDAEWRELLIVPAQPLNRPETARDSNPSQATRFYRLEVFP